jgi:hypothetical protein
MITVKIQMSYFQWKRNTSATVHFSLFHFLVELHNEFLRNLCLCYELYNFLTFHGTD